ncbi:MAG: cytochrome d ubiquinol oxidase subunit II [Acidimicrobiia bacterium]
MSTIAAGILLIVITAYAIFGGADFGAGFWDLVAGGSDRGRKPRTVIDESIGPVWEANHVWLVFALVVLWTGFPEAFSSIFLTLFVPFTLAAFGVVLRGSSFAFRHGVTNLKERRAFGAIFAASSVLVPFCLGAAAGAIASGRVPTDGVAGDPWSSWLNPTSILGGVLAVCVVAYLSAVYLVYDARRLSDGDMVEYFRKRALAASIVAGGVAFVGIFVLRADAPYLFDGLTSRALPMVAISAVAGITSLALLIGHAHRGARMAAICAVGAVIFGWGIAQWDYILPETLTIADAAAPSGTIGALIVVTVFAAIFVFPAIALLFVLDQRGALPDDVYADSAPDGQQ